MSKMVYVVLLRYYEDVDVEGVFAFAQDAEAYVNEAPDGSNMEIVAKVIR